ncbi:MAG TPA: response regulator transcription factor [Bacteroidetes bacterium]|nr:response regulator transcription factor [Bacteroidota bacterium]
MKHKLKFLIVDDHEIFRKSLMMTIKRLFPDSMFNEAGNGLEFLEIIKKEDFDLIFMDMKMPGMNGIEATKIAMKKLPQLKILGISMFSNDEISDGFFQAGSKGFIEKGGSQEEIKYASEKILNGGEYWPK